MTHPFLLDERGRYPVGALVRPSVSNTSVKLRLGKGMLGASVEYELIHELQSTQGVVIAHDLKPDPEYDDVQIGVVVVLFPQGVFEYESWDFVDVVRP